MHASASGPSGPSHIPATPYDHFPTPTSRWRSLLSALELDTPLEVNTQVVTRRQIPVNRHFSQS